MTLLYIFDMPSLLFLFFYFISSFLFCNPDKADKHSCSFPASLILLTQTITNLYERLGVVQCFLINLQMAAEPLHWSSEGLSGLLN